MSPRSSPPLYGAIEAGGTKWICAVGSASTGALEEIVIPTQTPSLTLPKVLSALEDLQARHGPICSLGVASFGPIILNPQDPQYGTFQETPKKGWSQYKLLHALQKGLGRALRIVLDTDVNAALIAEQSLGAARGYQSACYVTVGTGIGAGFVGDAARRPLRGRMHPEVGHLPVPELPGEPVAGFSACPFHDHCIEGKASGRALIKRWDLNGKSLPPEHPAWELEGEYLAHLALSLTASYSPEIIVFGGGVMQHGALFPIIRRHFDRLAGGYWDLPALESYLVASSLQDRAGLRGAFQLAAMEQSDAGKKDASPG